MLKQEGLSPRERVILQVSKQQLRKTKKQLALKADWCKEHEFYELSSTLGPCSDEMGVALKIIDQLLQE